MKTYNLDQLSESQKTKLCNRSLADDASISQKVSLIIEEVKTQADKALFSFSQNFDKVTLTSLCINQESIAKLAANIPQSGKEAIDIAYKNIHKFHLAQLKTEAKIETMEGVSCWRENRAIEKVGLYIPGGSAVLPSTFLMLGIPAQIAGCKDIVVCTPPQKDGAINCYIAYVATLLNIDKIYLTGGAQAIAAMAYGTESIPQVYKIFGPGNRYVTEAKKQLQSLVAIDMPAGPSEVLIIADKTAKPAFIAADMLAQAEHGADSQVILVSNSEEIIKATQSEIEKQLATLPRKEIATLAIQNSYCMLTQNINQALEFSNQYAPEHLILAIENFEPLLPNIINAGSVFLGNLTPESAGDYASGTNHTLPTSGYAKSYSGVSVDTFIKKITFQQLNQKGLNNIASTVETLAQAEGLDAHKNAITIRRS